MHSWQPHKYHGHKLQFPKISFYLLLQKYDQRARSFSFYMCEYSQRQHSYSVSEVTRSALCQIVEQKQSVTYISIRRTESLI